MLELISINFKKFNQNLYSHYINLFPEEERKSPKTLKKLYKKNLLKFLMIMDGNINVGFIIYEVIENNPYILLDYFGIFPDYQNRGYGSKTVPILKDFFSNYDAIYGEVEKIGMGKNEQENKERERRVSFYKKLDFTFFEDCDLNLWDVVYTPCILKIKEIEVSSEEVIKYAFQLYHTILGKRNVEKHSSYIIRRDS